jgi:DNA-binding transcriptional ArsR family regulator
MSRRIANPKIHIRKQARRPARAQLFAALGDETRLALVGTLASGEPHSIAQLTSGTILARRGRLTRQAITKHLRVLQKAGMVHSMRAGRESLFQLDPEPLRAMNEYIDLVSRQWDHALARLKAFVEE